MHSANNVQRVAALQSYIWYAEVTMKDINMEQYSIEYFAEIKMRRAYLWIKDIFSCLFLTLGSFVEADQNNNI